jgi:hypothetical protein
MSSNTIRNLSCAGVASPLVEVSIQYQAALDSGLPDVSSRLVFQDHFLEAKSALTSYTDDLVWVVRGTRASSLHTHVSLIRRGSADAACLLEEAQKEEDNLGGSSSSSMMEPSGDSDNFVSPQRASSDHFAAEESGSQRLFRMLSDSVTPLSNRKRRIPPILWPETLALNLVTQWKFTLTVAVTRFCDVNGRTEMVAVRKEVHQVFGQPTKTVFSSDKDARGESGDTLDYPNIYFNVENFDQGAFRDIQLSEGYNLAVLLTAGDTTDSSTSLFRGVLSYDVIMGRVLRKSNESQTIPTEENKEFIPLLGPERKGKAEIALSISDADLQQLSFCSPTQKPPASPSVGGEGLFSSLKKALSSDKKQNGRLTKGTLRGDEILQCCLTFVSVSMPHICHILTSTERANSRQWLYVPETRKELDTLLEASWTSNADQESPASPQQPPRPKAKTNDTTATEPRPQEEGGLFASFRKRFA